MAVWKITYTRDESTDSIELKSAHKPSLDEAVQALLNIAEANFEAQPPRDLPHEEQTPAVRLQERYMISVTGICEE